MPKVFIKRGTRAQLEAAKAASGLNAGELYLITDENKLAVGTAVNAYVEVQAQDGDLDAIAALSGTSGLLKKTAANTWALDTATYLTSAAIGASVQAWDADLDTWATKTAPSGTVVGTTDTQTLSGKTITGTKETVYTVSDGASVTLNPANGGIQTWTLGAARTATLSFNDGEQMLLIASGNYALTLTGATYISATDAAGSAPAASASRARMIELFKAGGTIYAGFVGYA